MVRDTDLTLCSKFNPLWSGTVVPEEHTDLTLYMYVSM